MVLFRPRGTGSIDNERRACRMKQKLDRIMFETSVVYIALPVFIFLAGWLRLTVAIPACVIFLISLYMMLKNRPDTISWHLTRAQWGVVLASFLILALWVFFSGQGGFSFQNSDFHYRNAIFRDLIEKPWPVMYDYSAQNIPSDGGIAVGLDTMILTYYIAFWLPGALVGKIFGWYAANAFLYFWALLGVSLITYYLFRTLRNVSVWSVIILIFFSGLDLLGYLLLSKGVMPGPIAHIEWWSGLQYSSNTTLLYWVFNQTIAIWLAILLILNLKNTRSLLFLYAMLLLHGPFPFLGLLPIVLWKAYQGYPLRISPKSNLDENAVKTILLWAWNGVRRAITFENVCGGILVLAIIYLYLSNNISGRKVGVNAPTINMFLLFIFEGGLYLLFLFADHRKNPLYWICIGSLLVIPFFAVGDGQNFCMRVSIPALFMIQILIQKTLLGKEEEKTATNTKLTAPIRQDITAKSSGKPAAYAHGTLSVINRRFVKCILVILLIIGAAVPIQEMSRSVVYTLPSYEVTRSAMISIGTAFTESGDPSRSTFGNTMLTQSQYGYTWADDLRTLGNGKGSSNPSVFNNLLGSTQDNLFYKYLARQ